jgi:NTP pyrophosphatase (non-canonical NTP hydrolase)
MPLTDRALTAFYEIAEQQGWKDLHNVRSLSTAVAVEAGELFQLVCWLKDTDANHPEPALVDALSDEIADIYLYLVALCDQLGVDFQTVVTQKIHKNRQRYG